MAQQTSRDVAGAPAGSATTSPYREGGHEKEPITSRLPVAGDISSALETEQQYLGKEDKGEVVRSFTPGHFDAGVSRIVGTLQRLLSAGNMSDHFAALEAFAKDMVWDNPLMLLRGRDNVRTTLYFAKPIISLEMDPDLVQVVRLPDLQSHLVEITGMLHVRPRRTWLLLPTLLLPKSVPFKMTFKMGITGNLEDGRIELLYDRPHNIPELPTTLRVLNGFVVGNFARLTEPFWGPVAGFLGDDYYKHRYQPGRVSVGGIVPRVGETMEEARRRVEETARGIVPRVGDTMEEARRRVAETTRAAAEKVEEPLAKAANVLRSPVDAGPNVGRPEGGEAARRQYEGRQGLRGERGASGAGGEGHMGSANAPENPHGTATGALVGTTPVGQGGWNNM